MWGGGCDLKARVWSWLLSLWMWSWACSFASPSDKLADCLQGLWESHGGMVNEAPVMEEGLQREEFNHELEMDYTHCYTIFLVLLSENI